MVQSIASPLMWVGFSLFVILMLVLDLGVFHRTAHKVKIKEAVTWTIIWIALALAFNIGIWHWFGETKALEFLTGYLIEKALSIDNLFIFIVIFGYFKVPEHLQHRVLFWGIMGALILRAIFIALGAVLLQKFHWIIYPFGIMLIWTGIKLLFEDASESNPQNNILVRLFQRFVPLTKEFHGSHFFIKQSSQLVGTPLLLVLITIEFTDLIFAVDSIPAIFAVTLDPFIVYTSNIFAILGLRSLYFAIAGVMDKFHFLRVGLALVLGFVGAKMLISGFYKVPIAISLGVIVLLLGGSILISLIFPPKTPVDEP